MGVYIEFLSKGGGGGGGGGAPPASRLDPALKLNGQLTPGLDEVIL